MPCGRQLVWSDNSPCQESSSSALVQRSSQRFLFCCNHKTRQEDIDESDSFLWGERAGSRVWPSRNVQWKQFQLSLICYGAKPKNSLKRMWVLHLPTDDTLKFYIWPRQSISVCDLREQVKAQCSDNTQFYQRPTFVCNSYLQGRRKRQQKNAYTQGDSKSREWCSNASGERAMSTHTMALVFIVTSENMHWC